MIIDVSLVLVFVVSLWLGWTLRIYLDGLRVLWIFLFAALVWIILPYFITFVAHSSTNISSTFYFTFGILMTVLIFLSFFMLIRNKKSSKGMRRLVGSLSLAFVSLYSLIIIVWVMADYGWINIDQSYIFSFIPNWILKPVH